ncbi:MAG: adenylate/guanylate cyclase domain-containing protein [Proteobacteria bacterium]|nr:adenylate/guanylate cyclase domain-containing protein [Pseudomonadota bacterium]
MKKVAPDPWILKETCYRVGWLNGRPFYIPSERKGIGAVASDSTIELRARWTMKNNNVKKISGIQHVMDRIGNPLEWRYVNKTLVLLALQILVYLSLIIYIYLAFRYPSLYPEYFSRTGMMIFLRINQWFILIFVVLFAFCLWIRKSDPNNRWVAYVTALFLSAHDAIFLCGIGHATNPQTLLILFLLAFVGLLLFDPYYSLCVAISWILVNGFHLFAEQMHLIPYAWVLSEPPFKGGEIGIVWLAWNLGSGFFVAAFMFSIFGYVISRWRKRETEVTELADLLKKMFGRYLSTEVMSSLIENPSLLELGGEQRDLTIMMTDLRGFTALSERLDPKEVVQMLNAYFEVMVETVLKYNGTINEIIGDALLVIFGAPQEMPDQTQRAIACAIEMQNAMAGVNRENRLRGLPDLEMGIGINKAEVIVGNIGSSKRSKYTVVGSGVNVTSRIESYTVGGQILISDAVFREVGDGLRIDGEQEVYPKGSETPLKIYDVGGIASQYNLVLETEDTDLVSLRRNIPILYSFLGGKHVRKERSRGMVMRLSRKGAEVAMNVSADMMTNLKMSLADVEDDLKSKDFYGKIIERSDRGDNHYIIRFTSLPLEVGSYFQAFRKHAMPEGLK